MDNHYDNNKNKCTLDYKRDPNTTNDKFIDPFHDSLVNNNIRYGAHCNMVVFLIHPIHTILLVRKIDCFLTWEHFRPCCQNPLGQQKFLDEMVLHLDRIDSLNLY